MKRLMPARTRWGCAYGRALAASRSEEHTSELQSHSDLVCRLLLEKKEEINVVAASHSFEILRYDFKVCHQQKAVAWHGVAEKVGVERVYAGRPLCDTPQRLRSTR